MANTMMPLPSTRLDARTRELMDAFPEWIMLVNGETLLYANRAALGTDVGLRCNRPDVKGCWSGDHPLMVSLRAHAIGGSWRGRVAAPAGHLRVQIEPLDGCRAIVARPERVRIKELIPLLEERYSMPAAEARVLARVASGAAQNAIAAELAIPVGTVKSRLASAYQRMDVRNRTEATRAVDRLTGSFVIAPAVADVAVFDVLSSDERTAAGTTLFDRLEIGVVVVYGQQIVWANRAALHLDLESARWPNRSSITAPTSYSLGDGFIATMFACGDALGGIVRRRLTRYEDACADVTARLGLSPRMSELAVLLSAGLSYAQIAHRLGVTEGSAANTSNQIFERFGIADRWALQEIVRSPWTLEFQDLTSECKPPSSRVRPGR
ncbi:MAG: LuxR C-terminal-related transcriptional regulator [Polyangiales bacterium]